MASHSGEVKVHDDSPEQLHLATTADGFRGKIHLDYALAIQRGKQLQAEAYAQAFSMLGRGIRRFLPVIVPSIARSMWSRLKMSRQRRIAAADLSRLSPEILIDIGLTDGDISAVASGRIKTDELNEIRRSGWPY